jgi:hypothetical protein
VVVLLLPLSLAMDNGKFDHGGGGGGSDGPVAVAVVAVAVVNYEDWWRWHLMAAAALDRGHATISRRSKRAAIRGIDFGCATTALARNRAMAVVLEEEGKGEGKKNNGNCNKVGNGERRRQRQPQ